MTTVVQSSFNSGEWSPKLYGRVDLTKYRAGAALLLNYFVDYRGGASTRPGTKYILQCYKSSTAVRLIPFQASFSVGYVLEFGNQYVRFFYNGSPVLEAATTITSSAAGVFTDPAHGYSNGDWIFIAGSYYIVQNVTTNTYTLTDLFGVAITNQPFGTPQPAYRVYTISSPYLSTELAQIKFAQSVNTLVLCHPNHPPYQLVLTTATSWALTAITFGATISAPTGVTGATTLTAGSVNYAYVVTSVDSNGQESDPSAPFALNALANMSTTPGSNSVSWTARVGAASYNVYKAVVSYFGAVPAGVQYGFIGNVTGTTIVDTNIGANFSQTPPVATNPFFGTGVASITLTNSAAGLTTFPAVTVAPPGSGVTATAVAFINANGVSIVFGGAGFNAGGVFNLGNGVQIQVTHIGTNNTITAVALINPGSYVGSAGNTLNTGPYTIPNPNSGGFPATLSIQWQISSIGVTSAGTGYITVPAVSFTPAGGAATAVLGSASQGNPTVPGFFQQRLVLAGQVNNPQGFNMSKSGAYYNFDVSQISQPDDALGGTLVSGRLNTIRAMVPQTSGLLMFTDQNSWLVNGGTGNGSAVTPSALVANAQSFNGISDVPPIVANFDVLYVQAKGSIVRDSAYNIYANVYTGTDISALSSHLFYGYTIDEWAWAEEPFKVVWAVRSDGAMLTLTYLKEQEFVGWAHSTTQGSFLSVTTVVENTTTAGEVDAIYTVVQRNVNGQNLKYIERIAERTFTSGVADAWTVDCGINYTGNPATNFSGAQFLAGLTVTGLADGIVIPPFTMPSTGAFTLGTAASKVTVGLAFNCDLQTLPLELGDPTVQGKVKKIDSVDVLVADTLGLNVGSSFNRLIPMKDFIRGNVSSMLTGQDSQVVTDLINGQGRIFLDPTYTVPGQYCIRQSQPLPATILAVVPNITLGDGGQRR